MGMVAGVDTDLNVASGSFTATGVGKARLLKGRFNYTLTGTFVATVQLERSFDGGVTYSQCCAGGVPVTWTAPVTDTSNEPERGVLYRFNCTAYTSGTIAYRISQ